MRRVLGIATLAACAFATPASAATVRAGPIGVRGFHAVYYVAGAGETNDVTFDRLGMDRVRVADRGAPLTAGDNCEAVREHTAICAIPSEIIEVAFAEAGGGDDTVQANGSLLLRALGGAGDDYVIGSEASDSLDGGSGSDTLEGRGGDDALRDGDPADQLERDVLDGGPQTDRADYSARRRSIIFDLMASPAGLDDEADSLVAIEHMRGGTRNDRLLGTGEFNELRGLEGSDALFGRGGEDDLDGGPGPDRTDCGGGADLASADVPGDFIAPNCESLRFEDLDGVITPYPVRGTRRTLVFEFGCPTSPARRDEASCSGAVVIRRYGARRVIGRGELGQPLVRVRLTRRGRELAARRDGVPATLTIATTELSLAYTTRLTSHK